jgi:integrase
MTTLAVAGPHADDAEVARLSAALDPAFLELLGWDPDVGVVVFPEAHPLLGWTVCAVPGCHKRATKVEPVLCGGCGDRWRRAGRPPLGAFTAQDKPRPHTRGVERCAVPGCARPWYTARARLCNAHHARRRYYGFSLEAYLARDDLVPLASFGPCAVAACTRDRPGEKPYCLAHQCRYDKALERGPVLDRELWNRTAPAVADSNEVSLRALAPRVVAELLYGLQARTRSGAKTRYRYLGLLADALRRVQATALHELLDRTDLAGLVPNRDVRALLTTMATQTRRLGRTPEIERHNDVWDLAVFGHSRRLRFTKISQPWLREAAKRWALDELPRRRGPTVGNAVSRKLQAVEYLSESLRLQRADHGDNVGVLSRQDITAFCNRLAYLCGQQSITAFMRSTLVRDLRQVLTRMRGLGLGRPGEPLHGLADDFSLDPSDLPELPEDTEAGKDLPAEVMRVLCAQLMTLEDAGGREVRVAVELLIDTGRRPSEILTLAFDCLSEDGDGQPVLLYDNTKAHRHQRRLPVGTATAKLIRAQQERVRSRFPDTPPRALKLLPSTSKNPDGRKAIGYSWFRRRHNNWVAALPATTPAGPAHTENATAPTLPPFDRTRIFLYAYRHSYAQRHADAGVDVTVLKELMDHQFLDTTQSYYRVGHQRRRDAVDRVSTLQFDRHGNRIWRMAATILNSERTRQAVGEVAVPYGACSEPVNVAADGHDCPVRFRCVGCGHFRTDISYLPDLERYLADLLRHRERLRASLDADDWAKTEAMPSTDEISRVRRLIDLMTTELADIPCEERAQILEATTVMPATRAKIVGLGIPRVRQPTPDLSPERPG